MWNPTAPGDGGLGSMPAVSALIQALDARADLVENQVRLLRSRAAELTWTSDAATAMTGKLSEALADLGAMARATRGQADTLRTHLVQAERGRLAAETIGSVVMVA